MTILQGTMQDGTVIPVQVDAQGRLVAEGLQGVPGPQGPAGADGVDGGAFPLPPDPSEGDVLIWRLGGLEWGATSRSLPMMNLIQSEITDIRLANGNSLSNPTIGQVRELVLEDPGWNVNQSDPRKKSYGTGSVNINLHGSQSATWQYRQKAAGGLIFVITTCFATGFNHSYTLTGDFVGSPMASPDGRTGPENLPFPMLTLTTTKAEGTITITNGAYYNHTVLWYLGF